MRRLTQKPPEPREIASRNGRGYVLGSVAEVDRVDFGLAVGAQQARTQGQYAPSICCSRLREDTYDSIGVFTAKLFERDKLGRVLWSQQRRREGEQDGTEEGYAFDLALVRVRACEDWLEDGCEIEGVERRGKGRSDDGARLGQIVLGGV